MLATPKNTADSDAPSAITNTSAHEGELPGGLRIGTPQSDEPIVKDYPTPAESVVIPTRQPSSFDSDGDGLLTTPELIQGL